MTKFEKQQLSPDAKAAIQKEWDEHLSSIHPRHGERERKERTIRQVSRERSATRWRIMITFSVMGIVVTCLCVAYLWSSYAQRNLRIVGIFDSLCR
jgi:hypothetical protein